MGAARGGEADDPTAGLVNLFDIWMVFAVAVLLAFVQMGGAQALRERSAHASASAASASREDLPKERMHPTPMQLTREKLSGEGERLGTAYRLKSGQIVYVPDEKEAGK